MHQMFFPLGVKVADRFHVYGCGLTGSVLLKKAVEQALRDEKQFVGERDGACLLCHLNVIVLTGGGKLIAQSVGRRVG